ncbi:unnamed protein product, partial [Callosobruchus maculatus]
MCRAKKLNTSINIDNARSSSINSSVNVPAGHQCIRIFHQNGHCLRNKLLEFEAAIDLKENEFDIICLTEDWLKPEEEAFMKISGYTMTAIPEGLCNMVVPVCAMGKSKKRQRSRDNSEGRKLSRHELIKREVVVTEPPPAQNLSEPIALRWSRIAENGLPREVVEALLLKYPTPENCGQLRAIQLNPEVAAGMANDRLARDNFNADIQHQISRALCAVGRSLTLMLEENNLPSNLREEALTPLGDAGRLLANLLNRITVARRKLVIPTLNPNVRDVLAKTTATDLLFGSDISEQIKAAKSLHTTGKELRQTAVRSQTKGAFTTSKYKKPNEGASSKTSSLNRQGP